MAVLSYFLVFTALLLEPSSGNFDIDEINSIYYGLDILGSPIIKDKINNDVLMMVNRLGQEYACTLPSIPSELKSSGKDDSASQVESVDISELLKPMEEAPCLLTKKDWWTYEFCYGQVIKQYHMESGKITGAVLVLGRFESEYDWSAGGKGGADASTGRNSNRLQRFHSQYYTNGTKCDLTGEPRRSEVRFKCETDVGDYIERVDEPESCHYIVTIATTRVCHHPYLRPHPSRTPHHISCSPVLEEAKYNKYLQRQERKKKAQEEKAKQAALAGDGAEEESDINIKLINFGSALKDIASPFQGAVSTDAAAAVSAERPAEAGSKGNFEPAAPGSASSEAVVGVASVTEVSVTDEEEPKATDEQERENESLAQGAADGPKVGKDEKQEDDEKEGSKSEETLPRSETQLDKLVQRIGKHYSKMTNADLIEASVGLNKLREQLSAGTDELQDLLEDTLSDLDQELVALSEMAETRGDQGKVQLWQSLAEKVKKMREKSKLLGSAKRKEKEPEFGTDEWLQWRIKKNEKIIAKAQETLASVGDMNKIMDAKTMAEAEKMVKEAVAAQAKVPKADGEKEESEDEDMFQLLSSKDVDEFIKEYLSDQDAGSKDDDAKLSKSSTKSKQEEAEEADDASVVISSLQQSIKNKIKEAGIDVNKHKIEVQILTPGAKFGGVEEKLSAEQAASVETLVVKLMGAQKEEIIEREKHETLNDNYSFSFDDLASDEDGEFDQTAESALSDSPASDQATSSALPDGPASDQITASAPPDGPASDQATASAPPDGPASDQTTTSTLPDGPVSDQSQLENVRQTSEETGAEQPISNVNEPSATNEERSKSSRDTDDAPPISGSSHSNEIINEPAEHVDRVDDGD